MKKILSFILILSLIFSLFAIPAHAEVNTDSLKDIVNKLNMFCAKEYFSESEKWDDYKKSLKAAEKYVSSANYSEEFTREYYDDLKSAYTALMFDTFDYSQLMDNCELYSKLDSTAFTEESWAEYREAVVEAYNELISPSLYGTANTINREKYIQSVQVKINKFSDDVNSSFNNLELIEIPQYSRNQLSAFISIFEKYALNNTFKYADSWLDFEDALNEAKNILETEDAKAQKIHIATDSLIKKYKKIFQEISDFSPVTDAIENYKSEDPSIYLSSAFENYRSHIEKLESKKNTVIFFAYDTRLSDADIAKMINSYLSSLAKDCENLRNELPTVKDQQSLTALVNFYKSVNCSDDTRIYYDKLQDAVAEGERILKNNQNSHSSFDAASNKIVTAGNILKAAQDSLNKQNESPFSARNMTNYLLISLTAALFISIVYSQILSKIFFGKINWKK